MLLRDVCMPDVVYCGPDTRVTEAAHLMRHRHVGDLVIVEDPAGDRIPLGVVTDRDIVVEVLANNLDPATTTVADIMRTPVVIAADSEDTEQAMERMRAHGVRRLPVVGAGGALVGIVTLDDLLKVLAADANASCWTSWRRRRRTSIARGDSPPPHCPPATRQGELYPRQQCVVLGLGREPVCDRIARAEAALFSAEVGCLFDHLPMPVRSDRGVRIGLGRRLLG